jgi:thioredoxin reductase (NADPH)
MCQEAGCCVSKAGPNVDVAIVGGGAAGLFACSRLETFGLSFSLLECLPVFGGKCTVFFPGKEVYGLPGVSSISGAQFVSILASQAGLPGRCFLKTKVGCIKKEKEGFSLFASDGALAMKSKYVIIASGGGEMAPVQPRDVAGLEYAVQCSFACFYGSDPWQYQNKIVAVAGGGNSAADCAISISAVAQRVFLIHRKDKLSCEYSKTRELLKLCQENRLEILLSKRIVSLDVHNSDKSIVVYDSNDDAVSKVAADHVVFCYGFTAKQSEIQGLDLEMHQDLISVDIETMQTSVDRCFAIGDGIHYVNKQKNLISCCFEADKAVQIISKDRYP